MNGEYYGFGILLREALNNVKTNDQQQASVPAESEELATGIVPRPRRGAKDV